MTLSFISVFVFLALNSLVSARLDFTGFEPLSNPPPQDFAAIQLGLDCPDNHANVSEIVNLIHWTVEPLLNDQAAESVVISTDPPDLVDAMVVNGVLRFTYNGVSMTTHKGGSGVLIRVPQDQLEEVTSVSDTMFVGQVVSGFTNLARIMVNSRQGQLVVGHRDAIMDEIELVVKGKSNNVHIEFSERNDLKLTFSGNNSFVVIDGSITTGLVSGNKNILRVHKGIGELLVSGNQNRIISSTSYGNPEQCEKVYYEQIQRSTNNENTCTTTATEVQAPYVTERSFLNMTLTCTEAVLPSSGAVTWQVILWQTVATVAILLWAVLA